VDADENAGQLALWGAPGADRWAAMSPGDDAALISQVRY